MELCLLSDSWSFHKCWKLNKYVHFSLLSMSLWSMPRVLLEVRMTKFCSLWKALRRIRSQLAFSLRTGDGHVLLQQRPALVSDDFKLSNHFWVKSNQDESQIQSLINFHFLKTNVHFSFQLSLTQTNKQRQHSFQYNAKWPLETCNPWDLWQTRWP